MQNDFESTLCEMRLETSRCKSILFNEHSRGRMATGARDFSAVQKFQHRTCELQMVNLIQVRDSFFFFFITFQPRLGNIKSV